LILVEEEVQPPLDTQLGTVPIPIHRGLLPPPSLLSIRAQTEEKQVEGGVGEENFRTGRKKGGR
jgi:hypothetical protein